MVTANGTRRKKTAAKAKTETGDEPLSPLMKKIIVISFAVIVAFLVINALLDTRDYQSRPMLDTTHEIQDVKPTSLLTEITNVTQDSKDGTIMKVEFTASNTNATVQVKRFECSIDMAPWAECLSPVTLDLKQYDDTTHTLEIRVIDNHNGIEEQPLTHLFK